MARSVHTRAGVNDNGSYRTFSVIQHWDKEGIPFQVELIEQRYSLCHEHEVEIRLIPSGLDDLTIKNQQGQVMFSLRNIREWLEAEYLVNLDNGRGDCEYDKKRDDEATEVEDASVQVRYVR